MVEQLQLELQNEPKDIHSDTQVRFQKLSEKAEVSHTEMTKVTRHLEKVGEERKEQIQNLEEKTCAGEVCLKVKSPTFLSTAKSCSVDNPC